MHEQWNPEAGGYFIEKNPPLNDRDLALARNIQQHICDLELAWNTPYEEHAVVRLPEPIAETTFMGKLRKFAVGKLREQTIPIPNQPAPPPEARVIDEPLPNDHNVQAHQIPRTQHGRVGTFKQEIYMELLQKERQKAFKKGEPLPTVLPPDKMALAFIDYNYYESVPDLLPDTPPTEEAKPIPKETPTKKVTIVERPIPSWIKEKKPKIKILLIRSANGGTDHFNEEINNQKNRLDHTTALLVKLNFAHVTDVEVIPTIVYPERDGWNTGTEREYRDARNMGKEGFSPIEDVLMEAKESLDNDVVIVPILSLLNNEREEKFRLTREMITYISTAKKLFGMAIVSESYKREGLRILENIRAQGSSFEKGTFFLNMTEETAHADLFDLNDYILEHFRNLSA